MERKCKKQLEYRPDPMERRRIQQKLRHAHERIISSRMKEAKVLECDPTSKDSAKRLETTLTNEVEVALLDKAAEAFLEGLVYKIVIGMIDKSRQNPINKLGFFQGAGDKSMEAYWRVANDATRLVAAINGSERIALYLAKVGPRSDEGIPIIGGVTLAEDTTMQYREAFVYAKKMIDFRTYTYEIDVSGRKFKLDLEAFSRVLQHPGMVVACDSRMSRPIPFRFDQEKGFIMDQLRILENEEIWFRDQLPENFRGNGGLAEVKSPYKSNLEAEAEKGKIDGRIASGTIVEIKLDIPESDAKQLLALTPDIRDPETKELLQRGTRKGFAEIFLRRGGMRLWNTYLGKAGSNALITPITHAMRDLEKDLGVSIIPVTGGYLQYWIEKANSPDLLEKINKAIRERIHAVTGKKDDTRINVAFEPTPIVLDATGMDLGDIRARFILESLGKDYPVGALDRADRFLNFLENVSRPIQEQIFAALAKRENGGMPINKSDLERIQLVRQVCSRRRTIRGMEDMVGTLRMDSELPDRIRSRKQELEDWMFDFSWARDERLTYLFADRVEKEVRKK
ncbi:MAG: hypothetical protein ABH983_05505 [Candidatus Micrarchaeota archaeon]